MVDDELRSTARRLRDLVEPIAANVYFAPEAYAAYEALGVTGFGPG
jgi:Helix-turn-helix family